MLITTSIWLFHRNRPPYIFSHRDHPHTAGYRCSLLPINTASREVNLCNFLMWGTFIYLHNANWSDLLLWLRITAMNAVLSRNNLNPYSRLTNGSDLLICLQYISDADTSVGRWRSILLRLQMGVTSILQPNNVDVALTITSLYS